MKNKILEDYLSDVGKHLGGLSAAQRDGVLSEMRTHLEEDIRRRQAQDAGLSLDEATLRATHDFGDPLEIAASHAGAAPKPTPSLWRRATATRRRRVGTFLVAALLIFVFFVSAVNVMSDPGYHFTPREYLYSRGNDYRNQTGNETDVVFINANQLPASLSVYFNKNDADDPGCAALKVVDGKGNVLMDSGTNCSDENRDLTITNEGYLKLSYRFEDFTGDVRVYVWTVLPEAE